MINENVVATLTRNAVTDGAPELVSELRIVADQASMVTCNSVTNASTASIQFDISGTCIMHDYTNAYN